MVNKEMKIIDLFAGIGGIRQGFEYHGCECVFSSEWDRDATLMYEANYGDKPAGDITAIPPATIPDHDILLAGFPCQPFSIIGKSLGFSDTRGTLFFNIEEILRVKKPYAFILENVKQLRTHEGGRTIRIIQQKLQDLGYHVHIALLNALDFGVPQKRERIIIAGFRENIRFAFPESSTGRKSVSGILENDNDIPASYYASESIITSRLAKVKAIPAGDSIWHENKGGNISALPYSCALRAGASYNYLLVNGKRRLTPRELLRLQGFPDSFRIVGNYQAMRKLTGNSVAVPVIKAVAGKMLEAISTGQAFVKTGSTEIAYPFESMAL